MRKLTNSVDHIPTEALKECYQNFLKAFKKYIEDKEVDNIDSKTVIKDFMRSDDKLYLGNELIIIHCNDSQIFRGIKCREFNKSL